MIRVVLPPHLRTLAHVDGEVELDLKTPVNQRSVLDALEAQYPMLRGTIRDHVTQVRRPMVRFFACGEDLSHQSAEAPLPDAIAKLLQQAIGAQQLAVDAAVRGSKEIALQALLIDPTVNSAAAATKLLDELWEVNLPFIRPCI